MGDSLRIYNTILSLICQHVHGEDLRRLRVLAWAVAGLILTACINIPEWAVLIVSTAQMALSSEIRLYRWLRNPLVQVNSIYLPLIKAVLQDWKEKTCYLVLDTSCFCDKYVLIRIALIYRGRAVPLAWRVKHHASAKVSSVDYAPLLQEVAQILPDAKVVLLADRGFTDVALMRLCWELGWSFRIRVKSDMRVYPAGKKQSYPVCRLKPSPGQVCFRHNVFVTRQRIGPVHLALAWVKTEKGKALWYVLSDEPTSLSTLEEYGLRMGIEESFLDDKSNGFHLEDSRLDDEMILNRLLLVMAIATVYLVSTGTEVVAKGWRRMVDSHWTRGLSYFKIGWKWVRRCLSLCLELPRVWRLSPEPDPEPAFASHRQRDKPRLHLTVVS